MKDDSLRASLPFTMKLEIDNNNLFEGINFFAEILYLNKKILNK